MSGSIKSESETSIGSFFANFLGPRAKRPSARIQVRKKRKEDIPKLTCTKIIQLIATCCAFIQIGVATSIIGATLIDLKVALGVDNDSQSYIIPSISSGDIVGTIVGGYLADRTRIDQVSAINLAFSALTCFAMSWNRNKYFILGCFCVMGFTTAFLEIVMDVWIVNLWAGYGGRVTHIAYFFFGLGTLFGPLIAQPFLSLEEIASSNETTTEIPLIKSTENSSSLSPSSTVYPPNYPVHRVFIPYTIFAYYCLFLAIFLALISLIREKPPKPEKKRRVSNYGQSTTSKIGYAFIMIFFFLLSQAINGLDVSFGLLLMNFAVISKVSMSKSEGVYLTATYWGTYTFTRIITMILMRFVSDKTLMWAHLCISGFSICLLWVSYPDKLFLWISATIMGAGVSPTAPLVLSHFNSYIKVTGRIATLFLLADCLGEFVYPTAMDYYLSDDPKSFIRITFLAIFSSMFYFLILDFLLKIRQKQIDLADGSEA